VRLATFLLIGPLLAVSLLAQTPVKGLPWEGQPEPPWRASEAGPPPPPLPPVPLQTTSTRRIVSLTAHGVLRILDERGLVRLRLGLPGRPVRLWRDGGTPLTLSDFPMDFPTEMPISKGLGSLALASVDFRTVLQGLLWILDDGEKRITLVNPATGQVSYLMLPGGRDLELLMYPDRLELREPPPETGSRKEAACWAVPWIGLFPQLLHLATPPPTPPPGTALIPFSKED